MPLKLKVDLDELTLGDMIALETNTLKMSALRDLVARFVVDEQGNYLPEVQAKEAANGLKKKELTAVFEQISNALKESQTSALPKASASG